MKTALAWLGAKRAYLTLLLVAAAAAFLWVQFATMRADRDALMAFADRSCAAAGAELVTKGEDRGALCSRRIAHLAAFERETAQASAEILSRALADQQQRLARDTETAARAAEAARAAAARMGEVDADVQDDRVGADWFRALNDLAGLRRKD